MIPIARCPACASSIRPCFEANCEGRRMAVSRCQGCGSFVKNPFFGREEIAALYGRYDHHVQHFDPGPGEIDNLVAKIRRFEQILGRRGALLEIGCGRGHLLRQAALRGWEAHGLEIEGSARDHLLPEIEKGVRFIRSEGDYVTLPSNAYDAVCSYQVLEHLLDPAAAIGEWARALKPGGVLVVDTPNAASLASRLHAGRWLHHRRAEHFILFTPRALRRLCRAADLSVVRVHYGGAPPVCSASPSAGKSARRIFRHRGLTRFARTLLEKLGVGDNVEVISQK